MLNRLTQRSSRLEFSPYEMFTHDEWAKLRADTPMTLTEEEVAALSGVIERISADEVEHIYLPLSRLLNFYVGAANVRQRKRGSSMTWAVPTAHSVTTRPLLKKGASCATAMSSCLAQPPHSSAPDNIPTNPNQNITKLYSLFFPRVLSVNFACISPVWVAKQ
jgi:hypothetical protein